jgi:hypothetical protein
LPARIDPHDYDDNRVFIVQVVALFEPFQATQ